MDNLVLFFWRNRKVLGDTDTNQSTIFKDMSCDRGGRSTVTSFMARWHTNTTGNEPSEFREEQCSLPKHVDPKPDVGDG